MSGLHVAVVTIGKLDAEEVSAALARMAKIIRRPVELRDGLPVPQGAEDAERGQHRAATLMERLRREVAKLRPGRMIGSDDAEAKAPLKPDAFIFVTDVDLFTAKTDGVLAALNRGKQCAVISVKRHREAFYRRKANPTKQRARLVKELARMWARLGGMVECADPECVLSGSRTMAALDTKEERFCRGCDQALFEGKIQI